MTPPAPSRRYVQFLRERARQLHVALPPIGKTPRRWAPSLRAPSGDPPQLSENPHIFLQRLLKRSWKPIALQTIVMTLSGVAGALIPGTIGSMVESLLNEGFSTAAIQQLSLFLALVLVIAATEAVGQLSEIATWFGGGLIGAWAVGRRVSRAGRAAKRDEPAGDVVTAMVNDSDHIGMAFVWLPEAISATISTVVIIVLMFSISAPLGWLVLLGVPLSVALVSLLAAPIQKKLAIQREEQGKLTTISSDAVSGLRILRGIGGEDTYNDRYRKQSQRVKEAGIAASPSQAMLMVLRTSIPQLLIALVIGYGSYLAFNGTITVGELVSFFGYTWYLRIPIGTAAGVVSTWTRAWVGVKKLAGIYAVEPASSDTHVVPEQSSPDWCQVELRDLRSKAVIAPGKLTGIVCEVPEHAAALAARLARTTDEENGDVLVGKVNLRTYPIAQVREGIFLSEANAQVFRDSLQDTIMGPDAPPPTPRGVTELIYREHIENFADEENTLFQPTEPVTSHRMQEALWVADAADVEISLDNGLAGEISEKGRNISGGQRQRVALARAVYSHAPILILVEPTSAVDSHTEARIVERLAMQRKGETTVVASTSPLFLSNCDHVVVLDRHGNVAAYGTHESLVASAAQGDQAAQAYCAIIGRGGE